MYYLYYNIYTRIRTMRGTRGTRDNELLSDCSRNSACELVSLANPTFCCRLWLSLTMPLEFAALSILVSNCDSLDINSGRSAYRNACKIWDYLLTFNLEFSLIWSKKFTGGTLLFLLTRYLPFTDLLIGIIGTYSTSSVKSIIYCKAARNTTPRCGEQS